MLTQIQVQDFALVDDLTLDFESGLTILTGETGAGKSILIEALGLALGKRADSSVVRQHCKRADITVLLDISHNDPALQWLQQHELDHDHECYLRRTISNEGPSKAYINGRPVPRQLLYELGQLLVDIHGQNEHQSLLRKDFKRQLLDNFASHPQLLSKVDLGFQQLQQLQQAYTELEESTSGQNDQTALLAYQVNELKSLNLGAEELQELEQTHQRLANADTLIDTTRRSLEQLDVSEQSVNAMLSRIVADLQSLKENDKVLSTMAETLSGALILLQDTASELHRHLSALHLDPERLQEIEQRLSTIHDISRKHRVSARELPDFAIRLEQKLHQLENANQEKKRLLVEIQAAEQTYRSRAGKLTQSRVAAALSLSRQTTAHMKKLGMPEGEIQIKVNPYTDDRMTTHGMDDVEFLVTTNPNLPLKPLGKVASGGELSRISLAIHTVTGQRSDVPTMIFDEVDVGIGGGVAEIVGQALRSLSKACQVLCITHLPQVAAQGHHHLQVSKKSSRKITTVNIQQLSSQQRCEEIARMLGGVEITDQTRAHAEEMLMRSQQG